MFVSQYDLAIWTVAGIWYFRKKDNLLLLYLSSGGEERDSDQSQLLSVFKCQQKAAVSFFLYLKVYGSIALFVAV